MKNGDFSEIGRPIYDPATTVGNVRQQFANNIIPANRISAISKKFIAALPNPNLPGVTNNLAFVNESQVTDNVWSLKLDHAFSDNNRISYFHSLQDQNIANTSALPGPLGQGLGVNSQRPQNFRVNHDWIVRPNFLIHTTFGFSRTQQGWDNPAQAGFASQVGLKMPTDATPRVQFNARGCPDRLGCAGRQGQQRWSVQLDDPRQPEHQLAERQARVQDGLGHSAAENDLRRRGRHQRSLPV
jgi:hypothetical protein